MNQLETVERRPAELRKHIPEVQEITRRFVKTERRALVILIVVLIDQYQ